ncbi:hypothetical protein [Bacillus sp. m3-13]|uniref:hypothetical protein n=1 Tax=Bacillus sp. m3-13 TaxID=406124 RepID=UPI0001E89CD4|nr:hypothetical protein [Bacillus sp. m3-13]
MVDPQEPDEPKVDRTDKSSLIQIDSSIEYSCTRISQEFKNTGDGNMLNESIYYVYYNENFENPINPNKKNGDLIFQTGIIPVLNKGDSATLTFENEESELLNGSYKIVAFQSDGHSGSKKLGGEVVDRMPVFGMKIDVKSCGNTTNSIDTKENNDSEEEQQGSNEVETQDKDQSNQNDSNEDGTQEVDESTESKSNTNEETQETTQESSENAESRSTENNNKDDSADSNKTSGGESNE